MPPLVSILIPAFNSEKWISKTLESALAQTWQNKEIIVVNDGSKDNTLEIARKYESAIVKVISQENQGQSVAENRAFQESQGEFIEYLDADDLLASDKIERQIHLLGETNSEFVASGEWARFYKSPTEAQFIPEPVWADISPVDWLVCSWEGGGMMHGAAWLVPRKIAEKAGSWNESLSLINDFDYFTRVLLTSLGVKFCWGARTYYRSGLFTNLSSAKSRNALESAFRSLQLGTNSLLSRENSPRTRHACATAFQRFIYSTYPNAPDLVRQAEYKVQSLGGSNLKFSDGTVTQFISNTVGWKRAKRIKKFASHYLRRQTC